MSTYNYYQILSEIQQVYNIPDLEKICHKNLNHQMGLHAIKILINDKSLLNKVKPDKESLFTYSTQQQLEDRHLVSCFFFKKKSFNLKEKKFLDKVSKKIHLSVEKILKLEKSDQLKSQWETTFNSIATPLCITDESFNIVRTNNTFFQKLNTTSNQIVGKNAFETFFGTKQVSFKIEKGQKHFSAELKKVVDQKQRTFEILCQLISQKKHTPLHSKQYLILFRDITEDKRLEKQIFDSAKFAELGTIGSSIAHELNNPLAGMLAFLQLIKADLNPDSKYIEDIDTMEKATLKCKNIVENLLGFSRKSDAHELVQVNLVEVIQNIFKIYELKTMTSGVKLLLNVQDNSPIYIKGNKNLLTQAFSHLIQNSMQALSEQKKIKPSLKPTIKISVALNAKSTFITVKDNRTVSDNYEPFNAINNLSLTVAYKILKDHNINVDIFSQPNIGVQAKLSFQRLDLLDERQVFDAKI